MIKKKNNLSINIPESLKNKLPMSRGFLVYKHFNEKHSFYRDKQRRKRDIKAVEYHFPGIAQILKSVKDMENECVYCRLERDTKIDRVQVVLLELLKIATEIIASEQAYSRELERKMDMCTLFLDENFHLLKIIKTLQENLVIRDNELIKSLDDDGTEYAETVFAQHPDVTTHDIFLQDISQGWEAIDWNALELGEYELKRMYSSQESDSQVDENNEEYLEMSKSSSFDYMEAPSYSNESNIDQAFKSHLNNFIIPLPEMPPIGNNLLSVTRDNNDLSIDNPPVNYGFEEVSTPSPRERDNLFKSPCPDIDADHSYKSVDSYEISQINDLDICTSAPFTSGLIIESNETFSSIEEIDKYQISVEDLCLFEELFASRIQYYTEGSDIIRLLNAENAYLYNIIQNKLVIGNEIDFKEVREVVRLRERMKIQNEHWERLEKLLSNYSSKKSEGGSFYSQNPSLDLKSMDEDVVKYLSVFASISALLSERSFEQMLSDIVTNKSHVENLITSLNKISDKKYVDNHLLKDCKFQLSIQTELCNRLSSINNINLFSDSELVNELKKNISQLNEKIGLLETENADLLADCKNAAKVISMMETEIREKSSAIDKLNAEIMNMEAKRNVEMLQHHNKFINPNVESPPREKVIKRQDVAISDSLESIMKRALGNCLKDLEYAESYTICTTMVSSDSASDVIYDSDTDDSVISISRVQNHPILPNLLSMLERLHSGYMGLIRSLKEQCVIISRTDFDKYISLMNGLASLIRRFNKSVKYDHEIETIQILMQSEYSLSSSNLLYLLNIMGRLSELTQIILLDREHEINSNMSRTNARLEVAEDKIKLLEKEKVKILAEKDDLKYNISGLKREIDRFKYPLDRIASRLDRSRHRL